MDLVPGPETVDGPSNDSVHHQQLESRIQLMLVNHTDHSALGHAGSQTTSSDDFTSAHYELIDLCAHAAQLLLGLSLSSVLLCSVLTSMRQVRAHPASLNHRTSYGGHSATY